MPKRKYRLERTAFIGCRNTAYMDVDDAEDAARILLIRQWNARWTPSDRGADELVKIRISCTDSRLRSQFT